MRWWLVALVLGGALPALADGSGTVTGVGKLKVQTCGKQQGTVTWTIALAGTAWTATIPGSGGLSGGATPLGNSGRSWGLTLDASSQADLEQSLVAAASALCGTPVTLAGPPSVARFSLKLNKRKTRAKLTQAIRGAGTSAVGAGQGKWKMTLRGTWQELP